MQNRYPARADAVPAARRAVTGCVRALGIEEAVAQAAALAVTEACSNVVQHAYREQEEPGRMTVLVEQPDDVLCVKVLDEGLGIAPASTARGSAWGYRSSPTTRTRSSCARGPRAAPR